MNSDLRVGIISSENIQANIIQVDSSLEKLPDSPGVSYRGTYLSPAEVQSMSQPGSVVMFPTFLSSDINRFRAEGFAANHYLLIIEGKTGKYIQPVSENILENEVIFRRGTKFEVVEHTVETDTFGNPRKTIRIREVGRQYPGLSPHPDSRILLKLLDSLGDENTQRLIEEYLDAEGFYKFEIAQRISEALTVDGVSKERLALEYMRILDIPTLYLPGFGKYRAPSQAEIKAKIFEKETPELRDLMTYLQADHSYTQNSEVQRLSIKLIRRLNLNPSYQYLYLQSIWLEVFGPHQSHYLENIIKSEVDALNIRISQMIIQAIKERSPVRR